MEISTKRGDNGKTFYKSNKVNKSDERIEFIGAIDELQVALGGIEVRSEEVNEYIKEIQADIFKLYSDRIFPDDVKKIEEIQADLSKYVRFDWDLTTPKSFPVDFARVTVRKVERKYWNLDGYEKLNENIAKYLNRLSDLLWIIGRIV
ncbi:MAG: ATP:cob(I)alamin adenosyltransferase [Candidatus Woesearchaeota archaeon]